MPPIPNINARAIPSILSSIRSATQIEPRMRPKNNADMRIGCSCSSVSMTDDSAMIAARMPASSVNSHTHSMRLNVAMAPLTSRVRICLSACAPWLMLRINWS